MLRGALLPWWPSREPSVAASVRDPDTGSLPTASITHSCFCLALRGSLGPSPRPLLGFGSSLSSLPSPSLPRCSAVATAGRGGFAATRQGSQTLGWGASGEEDGGRSRNREVQTGATPLDPEASGEREGGSSCGL